MILARIRHRGKPSKPASSAFLVCVEGETERDYFEGLRKSLRISSELLHVTTGKGTSAANIARYLQRVHQGVVRDIPDVAYDGLWGVADTEWSQKWKGIAKRPDGTAPPPRYGAQLWALSSSSFERWLLLHFEEHPPTLDARASARRLGNHLTGYGPDSKRLNTRMLSQLLPLTGLALKRAAEWRKTRETEDNFTDVDILVGAILRDIAHLDSSEPIALA